MVSGTAGHGGGGAGGFRSTVTATGGGGALETALQIPLATNVPVAVGAGLMQAKGNRNKSGNNSKFRDSLAFVSKCLDEVLVDNGETDFAPCNEAEKELRGLAEKIAAYFAA